MSTLFPSLLVAFTVWACGASDPNGLSPRVETACQEAEKEMEKAGTWLLWSHGSSKGVYYEKEWPSGGSLQWSATYTKGPGNHFEFQFESHYQGRPYTWNEMLGRVVQFIASAKADKE